MYECFPLLFLLGIGIPTDGPLSQDFKNHLMRQHDKKFAAEKLFLFLLFDQNFRHVAAQLSSRKVKNNPESMSNAANTLNSSQFAKDIEYGLKNPKSKVANSVIKLCSSFLHGIGNLIPFSGKERESLITLLYAMLHRFALGALFLTVSPDDSNDIMMLRLCYGLFDNNKFPSSSAIEYMEGKKTFKDLLDEHVTYDDSTVFEIKIPFTQNQKVEMASRNPIATARIFQITMEILLNELLGLETDRPYDKNNFKKTLPRVDESVTTSRAAKLYADDLKQVFKHSVKLDGEFIPHMPPLGQGLAAVVPIEEHKKKSLHGHAVAWTTLKPEILQNVADHKLLTDKITKIINERFCTELPSSNHFNVIIRNEILKEAKPRLSRELPPPCSTQSEVENAKIFGNQVASINNIHEHRHPGACTPKDKTHYYGELRCRLCQPSIMCSGCKFIQLKYNPVVKEGERPTVIETSMSDRPENSYRWYRSNERIANPDIPMGLISQDSRPIVISKQRREVTFNYCEDLITDATIAEWNEYIISQLDGYQGIKY